MDGMHTLIVNIAGVILTGLMPYSSLMMCEEAWSTMQPTLEVIADVGRPTHLCVEQLNACGRKKREKCNAMKEVR